MAQFNRAAKRRKTKRTTANFYKVKPGTDQKTQVTEMVSALPGELAMSDDAAVKKETDKEKHLASWDKLEKEWDLDDALKIIDADAKNRSRSIKIMPTVKSLCPRCGSLGFHRIWYDIGKPTELASLIDCETCGNSICTRLYGGGGQEIGEGEKSPWWISFTGCRVQYDRCAWTWFCSAEHADLMQRYYFAQGDLPTRNWTQTQ